MGYEKRAASLADRLRVESGAAVSLVQGGKGDFEVLLDGRLIYSKQDTRRMPSAEQVLALLGEP
jgi:selT/selW/selH-like putative selenoprotein